MKPERDDGCSTVRSLIGRKPLNPHLPSPVPITPWKAPLSLSLSLWFRHRLTTDSIHPFSIQASPHGHCIPADALPLPLAALPSPPSPPFRDLRCALTEGSSGVIPSPRFVKWGGLKAAQRSGQRRSARHAANYALSEPIGGLRDRKRDVVHVNREPQRGCEITATRH